MEFRSQSDFGHKHSFRNGPTDRAAELFNGEANVSLATVGFLGNRWWVDSQTLSALAGHSVAGGEAGELQPGEDALVAEGRSADAAARTALPTQPQLPVDNRRHGNKEKSEQ